MLLNVKNGLLIIALWCVQAQAFEIEPTASANNPWTLSKSASNILIFTRELKDSPFLNVKAEVTFNHASVNVEAQFTAGHECWPWQGRCSSSKVLATMPQQTQIVYTTLDMPWPVSDRDFLFYSVLQKSPAKGMTKLTLRPVTTELTDDSQSHYLKPTKKFVRASSNIEYTIVSLGPKKSKLTILMHTDLGGDISPSFVNTKLVDELYKDIKSLIKLVETTN